MHGESNPGKKPMARRTKVARHAGIYYRVGSDGKRKYEITFVDEFGRRRWQAVDGNLEAAQAALDDRRRRKRSGEPVAPGKVRLADFAEAWLTGQTNLRPGTRKLYRIQLDAHILPPLGRLYLHELREDDVTSLIGEMQDGWHYKRSKGGEVVRVQRRAKDADGVEQVHGYSPYTIRAALVPLTRMLNTAVRRGQIPANPMLRLERGERPKIERREMRILGTDEIKALLDEATQTYRTLLATAIFTGARQGELLGLVWADIDLEAGVVRVRKQLDRDGQRVSPKTPNAVRDIELMPALAAVLRAHKEVAFGAGRAKPEDFVFASTAGTPMHYRNVARRGLDQAMEAAKLTGEGRPRLRFHDLRHTFASILISQGCDVVFVSRQLGHASTPVTLSVYAHLFDRAKHAQRMRDGLEDAFGRIVEAAFTASARDETVVKLPR
jgi:integrase